MFEQYSILVGRIFHPGCSHGCCSVRATRVSLPCGRYLLAPLTGNKERSKSLTVLQVKPTLTRFPNGVFMLRWTTHPCILYQICTTRVPYVLLPAYATKGDGRAKLVEIRVNDLRRGHNHIMNVVRILR